MEEAILEAGENGPVGGSIKRQEPSRARQYLWTAADRERAAWTRKPHSCDGAAVRKGGLGGGLEERGKRKREKKGRERTLW